ncbi:MAG: hypothetical protein CBC65_000880 [Rhodothermaceae bacterium TMED105]|jgi:hypothetical protein|nr:MAG: hypothetical protein CBC65_000880 [Rhodothermaceae bacterium TMED105]|tara:strand:+ start:4407 stop:4919 length:513 start_codon:yes stop_codon:yes gene_type:complete
MTDESDETAILVDSFRTHSLGTWLANKIAENEEIDDCDVVIPSALYELGMRTRGELRKQLSLDLPRSNITVNNAPATVDSVLRLAIHPRVCTQAAFAPPLEWIIPHGFLAHEVGCAVTGNVDSEGIVRLHKRLGLRKWSCDTYNGSKSTLIDIRITAYKEALIVGVNVSR